MCMSQFPLMSLEEETLSEVPRAWMMKLELRGLYFTKGLSGVGALCVGVLEYVINAQSGLDKDALGFASCGFGVLRSATGEGLGPFWRPPTPKYGV